jgi:hypothetical protein
MFYILDIRFEVTSVPFLDIGIIEGIVNRLFFALLAFERDASGFLEVIILSDT